MQDKLFYLGTKAIITVENEVLLLKRNKKYEGDHYWDLPGGRVKNHKLVTETVLVSNLKREVREETSFSNLTIKSFVSAMVLPKELSNPYGYGLVLFFYHCPLLDKPAIKLSQEHTKYRWVTTKTMSELNLDKQREQILMEVLQSG